MVTIVSTCWPQVELLSNFRTPILGAARVQRLSMWALKVSKGSKVTPMMRGVAFQG